MSTESGIPDFRSPTGLYASGVSESVFDIDAFDQTPERFYAFAKTFVNDFLNARPNRGHLAIAALSNEFGKSVRVCTQNIDSLHQEAGTRDVYSLHGILETFHCRKCHHSAPARDFIPIITEDKVPLHEHCGGIMKPDIVFFGEALPKEAYAASEEAVRESDLLVIAGTSLAVYPAANLPSFRSPACKLVVINRTPTPLDKQAQLVFHESISDILGQALDQIRQNGVGNK